MKPTSDDFEPRRDGWFEHRAAWGEVVVGTVIASSKRSERWEITEVAHGAQVEPGHTLWMRAREQSTGAECTVKPRMKNSLLTILTQDPADTITGDPTAPSDTEAILLLVEELGAEVMATRDHVTGEVTCPNFEAGYILPGNSFINHLQFAHGMAVNHDLSNKDVVTLHGQSHDPRWPNIGKGGFPHRHVPEDLSIFTGIN